MPMRSVIAVLLFCGGLIGAESKPPVLPTDKALEISRLNNDLKDIDIQYANTVNQANQIIKSIQDKRKELEGRLAEVTKPLEKAGFTINAKGEYQPVSPAPAAAK